MHFTVVLEKHAFSCVFGWCAFRRQTFEIKEKIILWDQRNLKWYFIVILNDILLLVNGHKYNAVKYTNQTCIWNAFRSIQMHKLKKHLVTYNRYVK